MTGNERTTPGAELRDHLANQRTFLAWVRTAATVMALGFVVAKFGIILDELPGHHHRLHIAAIIGTTLVVVGAIFLVESSVEFLLVRRAIDDGKLRNRPAIYVALSGLLVVVALVLAGYLIATS